MSISGNVSHCLDFATRLQHVKNMLQTQLSTEHQSIEVSRGLEKDVACLNVLQLPKPDPSTNQPGTSKPRDDRGATIDSSTKSQSRKDPLKTLDETSRTLVRVVGP